jgi:hypothetical protein
MCTEDLDPLELKILFDAGLTKKIKFYLIKLATDS